MRSENFQFFGSWGRACVKDRPAFCAELATSESAPSHSAAASKRKDLGWTGGFRDASSCRVEYHQTLKLECPSVVRCRALV